MAKQATPDSNDGTVTKDELKQVERANESGQGARSCSCTGCGFSRAAGIGGRQCSKAAGYCAVRPGWPDDPDTVDEAKAHPEVFARRPSAQIADHFEHVIGKLDRKPGSDRPQLRGSSDRRSWPAAACRARRWPSTRHRFAVCCHCRSPRCARRPRCCATQPTVIAPCRSPTSSSATASPTRWSRRGAVAVREVRRARFRRADLPSRRGQPQPVDRGQGGHQEP